MRYPRRLTPLEPWLWKAGCVLCLAALAGCLADTAPRGGVSSARVMAVSREYLPPDGGQTIRPPQRMADVATLWMPLTREERARPIAAPSEGGAPVPPRASAWLPPSEREVMRDYLYRLTVSQATVTRRVLERAALHLPMIREVLREYGLPPELAALPLVESAFEPRAVSPAGAAGLWQLMPGTARRFGLVVESGRDERLEPRKSTEAAARYLRWLHGYFQDWPLALAAYNCGEGAMDGFLRRHGAASLTDLSVSGRATLPTETLRFVPQFVAAAAIMADSGLLNAPEGLGSNMEEEVEEEVGESVAESRGQGARALSPPRLSHLPPSGPQPSFPENETYPGPSGRLSVPPTVPEPIPSMRRIAL